MPRGRSRKPRLGRIDAAVDAMAQFGFPSEKVKKVVKQLLKEYGGNDGWQFIEDCAYMELINAILREVDEDNVADGDNDNGGNQSKDMSVEDEGAASGTSNAVIQQAVASCSEVVICSPRIHNEVGESVIIPSPEEGNAWKDIVQDQTSEQVMEADKNKHETEDVPMPKTQPSQRDNETPVSPLLAILPPPPPRNTCPASRRTPSYGWIDSDDEEEVPKTQPSQKDNETPVSPLLAILPPPPPRNTCPASRRTPSYGWIDSDDEEEVPKTQPSQKDNETPVSPLLAILPPPPPRNTCPASRRTPCYGWIDSDDEGVPKKFIFLTPAREVVEKKSIFSDGTERKLKRKSRWDQQP